MPLINQISEAQGKVRIVGGTPGRNGMLALLDPVTLVTSDVEMVGTDCLSGFTELSDVHVAVNAKGMLFHRRRGGTWTEQPAHQGACTGILKVNDRTFVTFGVDGLLHIWDHNNKKVGTLEGHSGGITGASLSPDGNITTVSSDRSVRVWDVLRQRQRMFFKGFENPLVDVHYANGVVVVIDAIGQVFTLGDAGKPVKAGGQPWYPCCSWVIPDGQAAVFIAQRTGMIHRIPISV
jgi:WD40 repeat protein